MDIVRPSKPNKAAVIFMVSGGWISDHEMLKSFMPGIENAFIEAGFTVFEVLHGAQPRYKVGEIIDQVKSAAQFVRIHAAEYGIEANRLGVSGISSGGHLALMIAGMPNCPVNAVAAIAPPTDLGNWGTPGFTLTENPELAIFIPALGMDAMKDKAAINEWVKPLSPINFVTANFPPTLIIHGDEDKVVPLQQAQTMDLALAHAGIDHRLDAIPGGGHDEKTFVPGLMRAVQWFKDKLMK